MQNLKNEQDAFPLLRNIQNSVMKDIQKSESVDQSCLTLCDPMGYSPQVSSVHGILQARILGWVAVPYPRDLPDPGIEPRFPALQEGSLPSEPPGKPQTAVQLILVQRGS